MSRREEYVKKRNAKRLIERKKARLEKAPPNISENSRKIKHFMINRGVKGSYKDYVILTGNTLVDSFGSYTIAFVSGENDANRSLSGIEGVALIHKRDLKILIGEKSARKFWHPRLGRAGAFIRPGTKKNCTDV